MRAKAAGIEMSMYTKATNLPGFFAELMWSLACESLLEVQRTSSKMFATRRRRARPSQRSQSVRTGLRADRRLFGSEVGFAEISSKPVCG